MPRLLFVKSRRASFIELDERLLAERYKVFELYQPGRRPNIPRVIREVFAADVIVGWWASWHTFLPFTLAWLIGRPSLLIVGGFDTAADPSFGYGLQLGGVRAIASRFTMRRARILMTNSEYSRREIQRNIGFPRERIRLVYHGVPDVQPALGATVKEASGASGAKLVLTVGIVDAVNLERKGLRVFAQAAALMPDLRFVIAGRIVGDAGAELQRSATPNLTVSGWVGDDELLALYAAASVYVQASRHEGFGVAVAEAMLARCVPVVSDAGALPEVVGDTGVILADITAEAVADGVRAGLRAGTGEEARARVLERFSVAQRRDGLHALLDELLRGSR
ncbi:MAG: glycosyltransferase family 4 protein [Solirubrobacteraceae bacterium]